VDSLIKFFSSSCESKKAKFMGVTEVMMCQNKNNATQIAMECAAAHHLADS
jgi:hypothetical protein